MSSIGLEKSSGSLGSSDMSDGSSLASSSSYFSSSGGGAYHSILVTLNWPDAAGPTYPDLDLYLEEGGTVVYYGNPAGHAYLSLDQDAYPGTSTPPPPENTSGETSNNTTYRAWHNQYSDTAVETSPSTFEATVTNLDAANIRARINGGAWQVIAPAGNHVFTLSAYGGYDTGDISGSFTGGDLIDVETAP